MNLKSSLPGYKYMSEHVKDIDIPFVTPDILSLFSRCFLMFQREP